MKDDKKRRFSLDPELISLFSKDCAVPPADPNVIRCGPRPEKGGVLETL